MLRKARVVQKSRHSSLAKPTPSATLEPSDWLDQPPDPAAEPKATPIGPLSHHSDFWLDDKAFHLPADSEPRIRRVSMAFRTPLLFFHPFNFLCHYVCFLLSEILEDV